MWLEAVKPPELCPCRGDYYSPRFVEVKFQGVDLDVLRALPQGACPSCGSRVYEVAVLEALERLMRGAPTRPVRARL